MTADRGAAPLRDGCRRSGCHPVPPVSLAVPAAAFLSPRSSSLPAQPAPAFQACRRSPTVTPSGLRPSASGSTGSIMQTRWRSLKVVPSRSRTETCTTSAQGGILARSGSPRGLILFGSTQARERHLSHSAREANDSALRCVPQMPPGREGQNGTFRTMVGIPGFGGCVRTGRHARPSSPSLLSRKRRGLGHRVASLLAHRRRCDPRVDRRYLQNWTGWDRLRPGHRCCIGRGCAGSTPPT